MIFITNKLISLIPYSRQYSIYNKNAPWNVMFFGSDQFSIYSLKKLYNEFKRGELINKLEVVTNAKNSTNPVKHFGDSNNLKVHNWPVIVPENVFDVGLVVSFGQLIPEHIIKQFPFGILNVHASLLPRWRGAAPIIYAIANGDTSTGITIMQIKPNKYDIGDIITQETVNIHDMKMPELYEKLGECGSELLIKVINNLPDILKKAKPQPSNGITFAPKVTSKIACIQWDKMTSTQIYNLERALTGLYSLTTSWNKVSIKLVNVSVCDNDNSVFEKNNIKPGYVHYDYKLKMLRIFCANNTWISVEKIGVFGKKVMSATDFNNGFLKKHKNDQYFR